MTYIKLKAASSLVLIAGLVLYSIAAVAAPYTPPYVFTPNTLIQSSQVNSNFSQAATSINNIINSQISTGANIDPTKLNPTIAFPTLLMSNTSTVTIGIGTSGDTIPRLEFVSDGSIRFGAGSGTAVDVGLYRSGAGVLAVRDGTNSADATLTAKTITLSTPLPVASGGTGLATLTSGSYLKGNGVGVVTLQAAPIPVADGGTGVTTLAAGYVKSNGASAFTSQVVPIPVGDGGTGRTTLTSGSYLKGAGSSLVTLQAAPIPVTDGGTGATSLTGNGAVVMNAGGTAQTSVTGTTGQVLKWNGTTWVAANVATFGGDGSDGALSVSSVRTDSNIPLQYNLTSLATSGTTTWTTSSNVIINCTGTVTIGNGVNIFNLTLNARPNSGGGGAGATSLSLCQAGLGPCPGAAYSISTTIHAAVTGGGGGGCGGAGGTGGSTTTNVSCAGGRALTIEDTGLYGSGGGGGQNNGATVGGGGGNGGGRLVICAVGAVTINNFGFINVNGGAGTSTSGISGSGGGGSGGVIVVASQTSITTGGSGGLVANGGNGGTSTTGGGGGGGGGGWTIYWAPGVGAPATGTGGGAGGGSATTAATAGGNGQAVGISGTPNLPLMTEILETQLMPKMAHSIPTNTPNVHSFKQREVAAFAADGDVVKYCSLQSGSYETTCGGVVDDELIPAA